MKKFWALFLLTFCLFSPKPALAQSDIQTDYNVTYTVNNDASTKAEFNVNLTNLSSKSFASSYKLVLGLSSIEDAVASDPLGPINPIIKSTKNGKEITLNFNKHVVGIGKKLPFTLIFVTSDIVQKEGNIWEINIPGIAHNNFSDFNVHLKVPNFLGNPTYIKPSLPLSKLDFTKQELGNSGISLAFGNKQAYNFSLIYNLNNNDLFSSIQTIALPPTTNYQSVAITSLNPRPLNVTQDQDGNWLASYKLNSFSKLTIHATGNVQIGLNPQKQSLSPQQRQIYTKPQPYWQSDNLILKNIAKNLKNPNDIYQYVVTHLHYNYNRVLNGEPRLGALSALDNQNSAVCLEFSDLFVALARAKGIPARELTGFAYTQNTTQRPLSLLKDILHAWPEYYDDKKMTWIMVDPTWGNTTGGVDYFNLLDFDHFVFTIDGQSSVNPLPAGAYKNSEQKNKKDVSVTFNSNFDLPDSKEQISLQNNQSFIAGLPMVSTIKVINLGSTVIKAKNIIVYSPSLPPINQNIFIPDIPPFGFYDQSFSLDRTSFLTNTSETLTIQSNKQKYNTQITIKPLSLRDLIIGGILFVLLITFITIIAKRTRSLSIFK